LRIPMTKGRPNVSAFANSRVSAPLDVPGEEAARWGLSAAGILAIVAIDP
jgi:hypothetical protein